MMIRFILFLLATFALAVQQPLGHEHTGTLRGFVRDSDGAVISDATVTIQHWKLDKNNANRLKPIVEPLLIVDAKGEFSLRLDPGS